MTTTVKRGKSKTVKPKSKSSDDIAAKLQRERKALIKSLRGSLSWIDYSVDQYLREKWEETDRENRS